MRQRAGGAFPRPTRKDLNTPTRDTEARMTLQFCFDLIPKHGEFFTRSGLMVVRDARLVQLLTDCYCVRAPRFREGSRRWEKMIGAILNGDDRLLPYVPVFSLWLGVFE